MEIPLKKLNLHPPAHINAVWIEDEFDETDLVKCILSIEKELSFREET